MYLILTILQGGYYILIVTALQWDVLLQSGCFNGMTIKPEKGEDGGYTIRMSVAELKLFQSNQASVARTGTVGTTSTTKSSSLKVTMDPSALFKCLSTVCEP